MSSFNDGKNNNRNNGSITLKSFSELAGVLDLESLPPGPPDTDDETPSAIDSTTTDTEPAVIEDYSAIWKAAAKIVYSSTLKKVSSARTRIEPNFDAEAVRQMNAAADRDISIGGPHLAAQAIRAGLVDEYHQFVTPIVVGGGNAFLPGGIRVELELLDERRFGNGVVHLHYRTRA